MRNILLLAVGIETSNTFLMNSMLDKKSERYTVYTLKESTHYLFFLCFSLMLFTSDYRKENNVSNIKTLTKLFIYCVST